MKKFNFSLDKLKSYKEQLLDKEKNSLALLRHHQQQLEEEKNEAVLMLKKTGEDLDKQSAVGINIMQIQVIKGYQQSLRDRIEAIGEDINRIEVRIQAQLRVVIEATKEVSSLEKLEDKQLSEYNFKCAKADEQFVSEYILNCTYKALK